MKTYLLTLALLTHTLFSFSQGGGVGINDTGAMPDTSAILDISSNSKGLLIPRLSLTDTADITTISGATTSLIVHNTNDTMAGGNGTGLYQWNGAKWIKLIAPENGPGANGEILTSNGTNQAPSWKTAPSGGSGGCLNKIQIFTTSGTWIRPTGVDVVYVTIVGGGGGGGGGVAGQSSTTSTGARRGGGGGGGGQSFFNYPVAVTGDVSVTVGAKGTGGAGGIPSAGNGSNGTDGGDTSFGTLIAKGGKGGQGTQGVGGASGGGLSISFITGGIINPTSIPSGNAYGSSGGPGGTFNGTSGSQNFGISDGAFAGGQGGNGSLSGIGFGGGASSFGSGGKGGDEADAPIGSNGKPGNNGNGNGSGGGGGRSSTGTGGTGGIGGDGTGGYVIVQWSE